MSLYRQDRSGASRAMDAAPSEAMERLSGPDTPPGQGAIEASSRVWYRRAFEREFGERAGGRPRHWTEEWDGVGWRVLDMLRDQRSSAHGVARMVNLAPPIADQVMTCAQALFGRGPVQSTAHAIILIGYRRLRRILERQLGAPLTTTGETSRHWVAWDGQ
jgi:hypothetical protein